MHVNEAQVMFKQKCSISHEHYRRQNKNDRQIKYIGVKQKL